MTAKASFSTLPAFSPDLTLHPLLVLPVSHSPLIHSCPYICPSSSHVPTSILSSSPAQLLVIPRNHPDFTPGSWDMLVSPPSAFPIPWLSNHHLPTDLLLWNALRCLKSQHLRETADLEELNLARGLPEYGKDTVASLSFW